MPTRKQISEFRELLEDEVKKSLIFTDAFKNISDWIESNLEPDDVFTQDQLKKWAEDNGYIKQ